jgi:hypothetical protein
MYFIYLFTSALHVSGFFSTSSEARVQLRQWFKSPGYGVSARALTPYPEDFNHCRSCTPAYEDGLKENPKM